MHVGFGDAGLTQRVLNRFRHAGELLQASYLSEEGFTVGLMAALPEEVQQVGRLACAAALVIHVRQQLVQPLCALSRLSQEGEATTYCQTKVSTAAGLCLT